MKKNKEVKLAIGIPLSYDMVPFYFFESYLAMKKPVNHLFIRAGGYTGLAEMRMQLANTALNYGCTHLLMLDTDHKHHPDTIQKLLSHNQPIVSGLSFMRNPPYEPVMFRGSINKYETVEDWVDGSLIEVDSVGGACLLIETEVFKNIPSPWFSFMKNPDPNIKYNIGEDVYFCNLVKKYGYKIFVDTSCTNDHVGNIEGNKKLWEEWRKIESGE